METLEQNFTSNVPTPYGISSKGFENCEIDDDNNDQSRFTFGK